MIDLVLTMVMHQVDLVPNYKWCEGWAPLLVQENWTKTNRRNWRDYKGFGPIYDPLAILLSTYSHKSADSNHQQKHWELFGQWGEWGRGFIIFLCVNELFVVGYSIFCVQAKVQGGYNSSCRLWRYSVLTPLWSADSTRTSHLKS